MINVMGWKVKEERLNLAGAGLLFTSIFTLFYPPTAAFGFFSMLAGEYLFLRYS
ncbi:MAG: hypothetical protein AABX01_04020 [Candidatus Micrarchaeota archaeon]